MEVDSEEYRSLREDCEVSLCCPQLYLYFTILFYDQTRITKRKRKTSEAKMAKRKRKDERSLANFAASVNLAAVVEHQPLRRRGVMAARMCAVPMELRSPHCLGHTEALLPCPGPCPRFTKECVKLRGGDVVYICKSCKSKWECMCCHCFGELLRRAGGGGCFYIRHADRIHAEEKNAKALSVLCCCGCGNDASKSAHHCSKTNKKIHRLFSCYNDGESDEGATAAGALYKGCAAKNS